MKKSEILKIIQKAIVDHNKSIGDFEGYGVGADKLILERILEAGILPPPDDAEAVTRSIVYLTYKGRVVDNKDGTPVVSLLWEPEDEA